jgi:anthranilate phosphoribosyltransferase
MKLTQALEKVQGGGRLTRAEARAVMEELLSGAVPDADIIAFLTALRDHGETVDVLVGFAETMRARAAETLASAGVYLDRVHSAGPLLDTCGTGGDALGTFNVSTATAFVAAAAGVRVAKHGNRSISSRCGSADVLEALGVAIQLQPEHIGECLEQVGVVFLFAPQHHASTRHVMNARRALKTKTVFNLLGPLTNPLGATVQLTGVFDHARTEVMATALAQLGTARALVVAAWDGMDEVSTTGSTQMSESGPGKLRTLQVVPEDFGVECSKAASIPGGDAAMNAHLLMKVFEGERGPYRDAVLVNSSSALVVAGRAQDFTDGVAVAAEAIDSGAASHMLRQLRDFSQRHALR